MSDSKYTDVGAGWKKETQSGDTYISIMIKPDHGLDLSECWVSLMKNKRKGSNPKAPDYTLTAKPKEQQQRKAPPKQQDDGDDFF